MIYLPAQQEVSRNFDAFSSSLSVVLLSLGSGVSIGYVLGYRQFGLFGLVIAVPMIWLFQALLVFGFDIGIQTLLNISRTGASSGVEWILNAHLLLHPSIVLIGIALGKLTFASEVKEIHQRGTNLTADDVFRMLDVLSNHPELASAGWFASRWSTMDDAERRTWVNHKLGKLRRL